MYHFVLKIRWLLVVAVIGQVPLAGLLTAQIRRVQPFRNDAGNPAWCAATGKIAFERRGEIWLAGLNNHDECLTCAVGSLARGANRFPAWAPDGKQIVFASGPQLVLLDAASHRILFRPADDTKNLRFPADGGALLWDEKSPGGRIARTAKAARNVIGQPQSLPIPDELSLQAMGDALPGGRFLITAARHGEDVRQTEIYECESVKPACRAVAAQPGQHLDYARLAPSGSRLVYASTAGGWFAGEAKDNKSDLWLADRAGDQTGPRMTGLRMTGFRMTWFNEPANPNYIENGAEATSSAWSADGRWLLTTVVTDARKNIRKLVKIEFPEPE